MLPTDLRDTLATELLTELCVESDGRTTATVPDSLAGDRVSNRLFDENQLLAVGAVDVPQDGPLRIVPDETDERELPIPPPPIAIGATVAHAAVAIGWWVLSGDGPSIPGWPPGGPAGNGEDPDVRELDAPPLDRTVAIGFHESVAFLYTGENPVQRGVDPDDIDPSRVAVARGVIASRRRWVKYFGGLTLVSADVTRPRPQLLGAGPTCRWR